MPAVNKVGTQLLVSPWVRADGQALALVRQEAVAEIWRNLIEAQLPHMKSAHYGQLTELDKALMAIGGDRIDTLDFITRSKLRYSDLFDADGRPVHQLPTVRAGAVKA